MHRGKVDPGVSELPWGNELSRDHVNRPLVTVCCKDVISSSGAASETIFKRPDWAIV